MLGAPRWFIESLLMMCNGVVHHANKSSGINSQALAENLLSCPICLTNV